MSEPSNTSIEKLAGLLATVVDSLKKSKADAAAAQAILSEENPPAFDDEAAARSVAQARVADLMNGTTTADALDAEQDRKRIEAEKAAAAHVQRQETARKQLADANRLAAALVVQAQEIDSQIRREFASDSAEWEASAEKALALASTRWLEAYVAHKAAGWLRHAEQHGEGRRQFYMPDQFEIVLSVPAPVAEAMPAGYHLGLGEAIVYSRQEMMALIRERFIKVMSTRSGGLYPRVAANLPHQDD